MIPFSDTDFVILDVETTGLSPFNGDRVIEIGAVKVCGGEITDQFHSLIDPRRTLSYAAFLVNGISSEMLKGAPTVDQVLPGFLRFIGTAALVGHNVNFDLGFLNHEIERFGLSWRRAHPVLDTRKMARWLLPELRSYRLQQVAYALAMEDVQEHRAIGDVNMTYLVFRRFLDMAFRRDVTTLSQLLRYGGVRFSGKVGGHSCESTLEEGKAAAGSTE